MKLFNLVLSLVLLVVGLVSCSTISALHNPYTSYESLIESKVRSGALYDRGKQLLSVKVVMLTEDVVTAQTNLQTSFPPKAFDAETPRAIVSVAMSADPGFSFSDLAVSLGTVKLRSYSEITNPAILKTYYAYAWPHWRTFEVVFEKLVSGETLSNNLVVKSPAGKVEIAL